MDVWAQRRILMSGQNFFRFFEFGFLRDRSRLLVFGGMLVWGMWDLFPAVAQQPAAPTPVPTPFPMPGQTISREEDLQAKREKLRSMVEQRKQELAREAEKNRAVEQQALQEAAAQQQAPGAPQLPKPAVQPGQLPGQLQPGQPVPGQVPLPKGTLDTKGAPQAPPSEAPPSISPQLVMAIKPFSQEVTPGKRFYTEVEINAETEHAFDSVRVCISYPRLAVRPVKVFDYPIQDLLDPASPPQADIVPGRLTYSAKLAQETKVLGEKPLLQIVWESLGETENAELSLSKPGMPEEAQSALLRAEKDLLDSKASIGKACINAQVVVRADAKSTRTFTTWKRGLADELPELDPANAIQLSMRPSNPQPQPGEEFVIDVLLDNPKYLAFDEVHLAIGFDPSSVRVIDWDYNNWIRRGVNIFDGHAHETFPFNIHKHNEVDNSKGRIHYQMSNTVLASRPSGCLVRIHCKALTVGALSTFTLFPKNQSDLWFTDIRAKGETVLVRPQGDRTDRALAASRETKRRLQATGALR